MPDPNPNPPVEPNQAPPANPPAQGGGHGAGGNTPAGPGRLRQAWNFCNTHRVGTALVAILAIYGLAIFSAHDRLNHRREVNWQQQLLRQQDTARIQALESKVGDHEQRLTAVENGLTDLGNKVDNGNAKLLQAIEALGGKVAPVQSTAPAAAPATGQPTSQAEPAKSAEPVAQAAATPTAPAKASAKAGGKKKAAARAEPAQPAAQSREDALLAKERSRHNRVGRALAAARVIHENAEVLVDEVAGDEQSLSADDTAALTDHRQRYRPAPLRVTAWRDVRPDETRVVYEDP